MLFIRSKTVPDVEDLGATDLILGESPVQDLLTPEREYSDIMKEWSVREAVGDMFKEMKSKQQEELNIFLCEIPFLSDAQLAVLKKAVAKATKQRGM